MALDWTHAVAGGVGAASAILAALPNLIRRGSKVVDAVRAAQNSEILTTLKLLKDGIHSIEQGNAARVGGMAQLAGMIQHCTEMQVSLASRLGVVEDQNATILKGVNGWGAKLERVDRKVDALGERVATVETKLSASEHLRASVERNDDSAKARPSVEPKKEE